jgi:tyrosyl-tRNA synthetase
MTLREDFAFRGLVHQVTDDALLDRLGAGGITAYAGFDPTAASLHLGHLFPICTLRRLQLAGNRPIAVAGGGTGLIGDPSFRSAERPYLSQEVIDGYVAGIRTQLERWLDFSKDAGPTQAVLVDNSTWLTTMPLTQFLRDVGKHFTINQMIARESVRTRIEEPEASLSFTEFSYLLLQSYDYYRLHVDFDCTLQIGGSDQWTNILGGVDLIKKMTSHTVHCLTTNLLVRADGHKLGKSDGANNPWLDPTMTSPFQMHQYLLNVTDDQVAMMLRCLTFLSEQEIRELDGSLRDRPADRAAQRALANAIVTFVHGVAAAAAAERAGAALFSEAIADLDEATLLDVVGDAPTTTLSRTELADLDVATLLVRTELASSKGEARRFLEQGGVYVNNVRIAPDDTVSAEQALHGRYLVLRRGARQTHLVQLA